MDKESVDECCDTLLDYYNASSVIYVKMTEEFIITLPDGLEIIYVTSAALDVVSRIGGKNGG